MSVCLKYLCPFLGAFTGQDLKPFHKDASIVSTKEQEILENNFCMTEGAFYTWRHPTPRFPHNYHVERTAKVVLHHCIVKPMLYLKRHLREARLRQPWLGSPSLAAQTCSASAGICCLRLSSSWDGFLIYVRVANF